MVGQVGGSPKKARSWCASPRSLKGANTQSLCICVDDVDAHAKRARAAGATIATEPAMFRRLASGDAAGAVELALRRLRASGFRPPLAAAIADPTTARRWAAALAFPIAPAVAAAIADRFENPIATETA